ncbi:MAG: transglutaminase domain-containing protein [Phycisphaeraceae bacterium]|nr:transglutaminase domain-containing protein [Phycisphaeraceae bacterium]
MDVILHFRRLVYAQVMLGVIAFCIAERNPGLLITAGAVVALSWYLIEGPDARPMPRFWLNLGALAAVAWLFVELRILALNPNVAIGHFMMALQLLLLYGRKTHRDDGLVLLLSLLEMIAASLLSLSLLYGLFLAAFSLLAVWTLIYFNFSSTLLRMGSAGGSFRTSLGRADLPGFTAGSGYRWQLRVMAGAMSAVIALGGTVVFILMPRSPEGGGEGSRGAPLNVEIGFTSEIQLGITPTTATNQEPILMMAVRSDGQPFTSTQVWRLRGAALDTYDPVLQTWARGPTVGQRDVMTETNNRDIALARPNPRVPTLQAQITIRHLSQRHLFTVLPPLEFEAQGINGIMFNPFDQQITAGGRLGRAVQYQVEFPLSFDDRIFEEYQLFARSQFPAWFRRGGAREPEFEPSRYALGWEVQPERFAELAGEILTAAGLARDPQAGASAADGPVAKALADYLQTTCAYSLEPRAVLPGSEPITEFLFTSRQGHCELFASALAGLARSIGLRARVVTGYLVSEYNPVGEYFVVRESDAHAWVEVDCGRAGWRTFDATPAAELYRQDRNRATWTAGLRQLVEHLDFLWVRSVVAYDPQSRESLLSDLAGKLMPRLDRQQAFLRSLTQETRTLAAPLWANALGYGLVLIIAVGIVLAIGLLIRELRRRRRRLAVLRIPGMDPKGRRTLLREAGFYVDMLAMLEAHGLKRPEWMTPLQFSQNLAQSYTQALRPTVALTELFYEVRYGGYPLDEGRRQRCRQQLAQLSKGLASLPV